MKRKIMLLAVLFFLSTIIAACGGGDEGETEEAVSAADEEEALVDEEESEEEVEEGEEAGEEEDPAEETTAAPGNFSDLISYMEEETEGSATVLYENTNPQTHEMEGVTVTLDAYTVVELLDFHRNYSIPFDDENNGAVILAQYTVKNDTDQDLHYMTSYYMSYVGADKHISNYQNLLPDDQQLPQLLSPSNDYLLEAGDEIVGYYAYPIGETRLQEVLELGSVDVEITEPRTDLEDFSTKIGSPGRFTLPLDEESAEKVAEVEAQGFYEDKVTADNMGEKVMLEQKEDIGESQEIGSATVTLEGYQFTNFVPNSEEAPRFQGDEFVLLTVKFIIDNGYDEAISKTSMPSTLHLNDGKQWTLNERMLLPYRSGDTIEPGESGELLQIFLLDQEQYEKIWKDKSFEMELGPIRNEEAQDISKGEKAVFKLK